MKKHILIIPAVIAWAFSSSAFAGYAQLVPPVGWTAGVGAQAPTYAAAANEAWLSNTVRTSASLNVGGRVVTVPASMRLAANAPAFLASRIGGGMIAGLASPMGIGLTLASMLVLPKVTEWIAQQDDYRWNDAAQRWEGRTEVTGTVYRIMAHHPWSPSESEACAVMSGQLAGPNMTVAITSTSPSCELRLTATNPNYPEWVPDISDRGYGYTRSTGTIREWGRPADFPTEVQPAISPLPLPETLPNILPFTWPVQNPVINPSPGANPAAQPLLVPTGDPVPNPNYNPQQAPSPANQPYIQPAVRIKPSPTPDNPWRVDVDPVQEPMPDPQGLPDPVTPETPETPKEPDTPPVDTPLGEVPDLYERQYPDGMEGVWNTYKDQLKNTSLGTLASKLMPNIPDGGTCPTWPINLDMAQWAAFGTHDVAPPCYIWGIAKAILIVSALLLARALIFGG